MYQTKDLHLILKPTPFVPKLEGGLIRTISYGVKAIIDGTKSFDPDNEGIIGYDPRSIKVDWLCQRVSKNSKTNLWTTMSNCFGDNYRFLFDGDKPKKGSSKSSAKVLIDTKNIVPNEPYHVKMMLISMTDTRISFTEQTFIAKLGEPARFALSCNMNCLEKYVSEEKGRFLINCLNCEKSRIPIYSAFKNLVRLRNLVFF